MDLVVIAPPRTGRMGSNSERLHRKQGNDPPPQPDTRHPLPSQTGRRSVRPCDVADFVFAAPEMYWLKDEFRDERRCGMDGLMGLVLHLVPEFTELLIRTEEHAWDQLLFFSFFLNGEKCTVD